MAVLAIHCGAHKTATKSIQALLIKGRRKLNEHGINFIHPRTINEAISWPEFYSKSDTTSERCLYQVFEKSLKRNCGLRYIANPDRVVVSHESFFSSAGLRPGGTDIYPFLEATIEKCNRHGIFDLFDRVQIVFVVRRQDSFIQSLYLYHLCTGLWMEPFDEMVKRLNPSVVNWWRLAVRMSEAPGIDKIDIKPFESITASGSEAFTQEIFVPLLGESPPNLGKLGRYNEGFSRPAYSFAMRAYPHVDRKVWKLLGQSLRRVLPVSRFGKPELLNEDMRQRILQATYKDNQRLFDSFMPEYKTIKEFYLHDSPLTGITPEAI